MELREMLGQFPAIQIVGEAANAAEARQQIEELGPDLVFLDIQMPEETGLELLDSLSRDGDLPKIIFTTAYDTFAIQAFEFGAIDYLLKPISSNRLEKALGRIAAGGSPIDEPLQKELIDPDDEPQFQRLEITDKVLFNDGKRIWYVSVSDIVGVEADGQYSIIWLDGAAPLIRKSLSSIEARLPSQYFFRANRSQIVNLYHVRAISPWFGGCLKLTMSGSREIELSRRQARLFRGVKSL